MEVLLIEDSVIDARLVEAIISSSDLAQPTLHHASRFAQALAMLSAQSYDLVLLDLHLPDGEGVGLIKELKQQSPEMPVVVLTGLGDEAIATAALEEGAQDYVVKSETFAPQNLSQVDPTDAGNLLVRRIQYAVKRAELIRQQRNNQTRYELAPQRNQNSIWDWDLRRNQVYLSPQWKSAIGLYSRAINSSPDEWLSRIHPQDKPRFEKSLQDYLDKHQSQFYCEYRIRHAEGHYIWVLTEGKALWSESGVAYRIAGSQTDITARKTEEVDAYEKRELAQTALHTVGAGLLTLQARFYINEGFYEQAEPLLQCALAIHKSLLGHAHPDVAISTYNLASLYDNQFRFLEAESLFKEALAIFEETLGLKHPHTQQVSRKVHMICRLNEAMKVSAQRGSIEELWAGD
ncbi:MAG: response regulator [Cyanobacteria bacterium J06560_6]